MLQRLPRIFTYLDLFKYAGRSVQFTVFYFKIDSKHEIQKSDLRSKIRFSILTEGHCFFPLYQPLRNVLARLLKCTTFHLRRDSSGSLCHIFFFYTYE